MTAKRGQALVRSKNPPGAAPAHGRATFPTPPRAASDDGYLIRPDPADPRLTERVSGIDHTGSPLTTSVTVERALTIFLNGQEIVTAMTIGDYPDYLALGYLLNQNMLQVDDVVTGVDYDEDLAVVVVRTKRKTDYEKKLRKKVQTSGCAQGTVFGDLMELIEGATLPAAELRTSWLYALTNKINTTPSLYLEAGAIHGCVLAERDRPLVYMEDVGRHNAVDKIAGWMFPPPRAARGQDLLHHRAADLRDGHQDGADGDPDPDLALRLYRLGGRTGAPGRADPDRPRARQTLRRAVGRGAHRIRSGPRLRRRGKRKAPPQGGGA